MKKFTKITLILAAVLTIVGLTLCTTAISLSGGISEIRNLAKSGKLNFGNWHFEDGFYYRGENLLDVQEEWKIDIDLEASGNERLSGEYTEQIRRIEMDLDIANVVVKSTDDEKLTVSMEDGYKKYYEEVHKNDTLKITYDVGGKTFKDGPDITIYVPSDWSLSDIVIDLDLGNVEIRELPQEIESVEIDVDMGNITVDNCVVSRKAVLDADMGAVNFSGELEGNLTMEADMGSAKAEINGKESDYNIELNADMGEVIYDGHHHKEDMGGKYETHHANAVGDIIMRSSMGSVELSFR